MKRTRKFFKVAVSLMASASLMMALSTAVGACHYWFAQPKVPQGLEKFREEK